MKTHDPIVDEVRAARDEHAAQFGYDLQAIFRDLQAKQKNSGRQYVKYAARPAVVRGAAPAIGVGGDQIDSAATTHSL